MSDDPGQAFWAIFGDLVRQAPGSAASTVRALDLAGPNLPDGMVLDLGCGTGASTRVLARRLDREVIGCDVAASSLTLAERRLALSGLAGRARFARASLDRPPTAPASVALIWCEGAAYTVGVAAALAAWRPLLVPDARVVMSELVWLTPDRPAPARSFWAEDYPAMQDEAGLAATIAAAGYRREASFVLPPEDWWESYYLPLAARLDQFETAADPALQEVIATVRAEIALCRDHGHSYGYVMLVLKPA